MRKQRIQPTNYEIAAEMCDYLADKGLELDSIDMTNMKMWRGVSRRINDQYSYQIKNRTNRQTRPGNIMIQAQTNWHQIQQEIGAIWN